MFSNVKFILIASAIIVFALFIAIFVLQLRLENTRNVFFEHSLHHFGAARFSTEDSLFGLLYYMDNILEQGSHPTIEEHSQILGQLEVLNREVHEMTRIMAHFFLNSAPAIGLDLDVSLLRPSINLRIAVDYYEVRTTGFYDDLHRLLMSIQEVHKRHPIESRFAEVFHVNGPDIVISTPLTAQIEEWLGFYNDFVFNIPTWEGMIARSLF